MSGFRTFRYLPLLSVQLPVIVAVAAVLMTVASSSAQADDPLFRNASFPMRRQRLLDARLREHDGPSSR